MFLLVNCRKEKHQINLWFNNTTDKTIWINPSFKYPDTLSISFSGGYKIEPHTKESLTSKLGWDEDIKENKSQTLILFLIDQDTLNNYSFQEIESGYKIIKRYDLSLDYLKSVSWSITYP